MASSYKRGSELKAGLMPGKRVCQVFWLLSRVDGAG